MTTGNSHTYTDTVLSVPFLGYEDALPVGYEKAVTACGMCAIAMILSYKNNTISLPDLIEKGHQEGGYGPNGWIHQYFVDLLNNYNLPAERFENMSLQSIGKIVTEAITKGNPVVISGRKLFMDQTSFHIVLIVGVRLDQDGTCVGFIYHDPALTQTRGASYRFAPMETFRQYWRQMAIVLR